MTTGQHSCRTQLRPAALGCGQDAHTRLREGFAGKRLRTKARSVPTTAGRSDSRPGRAAREVFRGGLGARGIGTICFARWLSRMVNEASGRAERAGQATRTGSAVGDPRRTRGALHQGSSERRRSKPQFREARGSAACRWLGRREQVGCATRGAWDCCRVKTLILAVVLLGGAGCMGPTGDVRFPLRGQVRVQWLQPAGLNIEWSAGVVGGVSRVPELPVPGTNRVDWVRP